MSLVVASGHVEMNENANPTEEEEKEEERRGLRRTTDDRRDTRLTHS